MTTDLFALSARAKSIAAISIFVAGAVLVSGPAPARKLVRRRRRSGSARTAVHTEAVRASPEADAKPAPEPEQPAARMPTGLRPGSPVIGYVTASHGSNGQLTQPEHAIERACERAGWRLVAIVRDRETGRLLDRPGLTHALDRLADGDARGVVVTDARLLSRAMDFADLVGCLDEREAALIALDLGVDTSTPEGRRVASTLVTINGWAGRRIARRAAAAREDLLARIAAMHDEGMSLQAIADELNAQGVRTLTGAEAWWPSSVQSALRYWRGRAQPAMEELSLEKRVAG
jgi:Resolvase, N terminal domain/Recombinase